MVNVKVDVKQHKCFWRFAAVILLAIASLCLFTGCDYAIDYILKDVNEPEQPAAAAIPAEEQRDSLQELETDYVSRNFQSADDNDTEPAKPRYGGTLNIYSFLPDTLNPVLTGNNANLRMLSLVFESLVTVDKTLKPIPSLATEWKGISGGLNWVVTLKEGVMWHDGTPLTPADVVASYEAARESPNERFREIMANIGQVVAQQDGTIMFRLFVPQTNFISLLEIPIIKAETAKVTENYAPIGTGPYTYAGITNNDIYLSRFDEWHNGKAYIDGINVKLLPEKKSITFYYESREIDFIETNIPSLADFNSHLDNRISIATTNYFNYIGLNFSNELLSKLAVRRAIAHAINKQALYKEMLLSYGHTVDSFVNPDTYFYAPLPEQYPYDLAVGNALIEKYLPEDEHVDMTLLVSSTNSLHLQIANRLVSALKDIGIMVKIESVNDRQLNWKVSIGEYDMYLGEFIFGPDHDLMGLLDITAQKYPIGNQYSSMQVFFAPYLSTLSRQITDSGRISEFATLQLKFAEQLPCIPLFYDSKVILHNKRLVGSFDYSPFNIFADIAKWYIVD